MMNIIKTLKIIFLWILGLPMIAIITVIVTTIAVMVYKLLCDRIGKDPLTQIIDYQKNKKVFEKQKQEQDAILVRLERKHKRYCELVQEQKQKVDITEKKYEDVQEVWRQWIAMDSNQPFEIQKIAMEKMKRGIDKLSFKSKFLKTLKGLQSQSEIVQSPDLVNFVSDALCEEFKNSQFLPYVLQTFENRCKFKSSPILVGYELFMLYSNWI